MKNDLSGNTVWPQGSGVQKLAKIGHFCIFDELLSTQNVNVARFARNVERNFFSDFQTQWWWQILEMQLHVHDLIKT